MIPSSPTHKGFLGTYMYIHKISHIPHTHTHTHILQNTYMYMHTYPYTKDDYI